MGSRMMRTEREASWDSVQFSEASVISSEADEFEEDYFREQSPSALRTVGDVHRALHPLQETADRVGKQVEQFAETLDRLSFSKRGASAKDCRDVLPLVYEYERIASDTVKRLQKVHEPERQEKLKKSWKRKLRSSSGRSTPISIHEDGTKYEGMQTTVEDLQHWEQERQTWQLLGLMLQVEYSTDGLNHTASRQDERFVRPSKDAKIHRYSSERAVWKSFLADDNDAWERHVVVEWLKLGAESSGQDIDAVVEQLESGADRGSGLWAHGWLYSKEAIKGQKRLNSWPEPLAPDSPGIDISLVNAERTKGLVTQLDPDAITRQKRSLVKEDISFERATWLACWEMIRRGRSWESIREWCQERVEGWRAISMRGDPRSSDGNDESSDALAGWQSRSLWRAMCAETASSGGIDEYENAVYGALSGHLKSVEKIVRGWDDYLFAHYNSYLLHGFDDYLQRKFQNSSMQSGQLQPGSTQTAKKGVYIAGEELIPKMQKMEFLKAEALLPIKALQGSLIAKMFENLVFRQGLKLAHAANLAQESQRLALKPQELQIIQTFFTVDITSESYDMLRILTHMIFIFQSLEPKKFKSNGVENIIVAYIDYLGLAGKQQLLPLYVSRLSPHRAMLCMARQLPSIIDPSERLMVIKLMKQYGLDVIRILDYHLVILIRDSPANAGKAVDFAQLKILNDDQNNDNGMRPLRDNFIGREITDVEQDLLNGFEWYMLLDGYWRETMDAGTMLYKHFLRYNGLAAARELSRRIPLSSISLNKTRSLLGHALDINSTEAIDDDDDEIDHFHLTRSSKNTQTRKRRKSSSARQSQSERDILLAHASTYLGIENLMCALTALEAWTAIADQAVNQPDLGKAKKWKSDLQRAHDQVVHAMDPLLHSWLLYAQNDKEALENQQLRLACLPEIVLAYNRILNYAGYALSREYLLRSMDLAALITAEPASSFSPSLPSTSTFSSTTSDLTDCFVDSGRMAELLLAMSLAAKNVLRAAEVVEKGGKRKRVGRAKGGQGETLEIWSVAGVVAKKASSSVAAAAATAAVA